MPNLTNLKLLENFRSFTLTEQAFWKVFKTTIEDARQDVDSAPLSTSNYSNLFVDSKVPSSLSMLAKSDSVSTQFINRNFKLNYDSILGSVNAKDTDSLLNYFLLPFPFSLSSESDVSRYTWFDWYSLQSSRVTKAIDTSVFNLHGSKQYNFTFTKDPKAALINKIDNFFIKYTHARKLYLPINLVTPYFYSKYRDWPVLTSIGGGHTSLVE